MGEVGRGRAGRCLVFVLTAALLAHGLILGFASGRTFVVRQAPRLRQVLVVAANMEEAWKEWDNADSRDLDTFARRVSRLTPHAPDVLLLQEVTRASTEKIAKLLKTYTNRGYAIAASARKSPVDVRPKQVFTNETSILINKRTMKKIGKTRIIKTSHGRRHGTEGMLREVKRNVATLVRERRTGHTYPIVNVHFHTRAQLRSDKLDRRYRASWVRKVSTVIKRRWPHYARRAVIGGDLNVVQSRWVRGRKKVGSWWNILNRRGYRDSIFEATGRVGVDYVFTRTRIAGAGVDESYNPRATGSPNYYSDHRLRWTLLGPWQPDLRDARAVSSVGASLTWRPLTSVRHMRIERRHLDSSEWQLVARARGRADHFYDRSLEPTTDYVYRIVAWNGAEYSNPSRVLNVRTKPDTRSPRRPRVPDIEPKLTAAAVRVVWNRSFDRGGSGIGGYEVWRKRPSRDATMIGRTKNRSYADKEFVRQPDVKYFIVAYDRVGNRSAPSDFAELVRLN